MLTQTEEEDIHILTKTAIRAEEKKDDAMMVAVTDFLRRRHAPVAGQLVGIIRRYYSVHRPKTKVDYQGLHDRLYKEFPLLQLAGPNLILLDIDGVLINSRSCATNGWYTVTATDFLTHPEFTVSQFDQYGLGFLRNLCHLVDAKVALCSTWRTSFDHDELKAFQYYTGLPMVNSTNNDGNERKTQILHYLMNYKEVQKAAIIDDEKYTVNRTKHNAEIWQHRISQSEGITYRQMESISKFFGVSAYDVIRLAKMKNTALKG